MATAIPQTDWPPTHRSGYHRRSTTRTREGRNRSARLPVSSDKAGDSERKERQWQTVPARRSGSTRYTSRSAPIGTAHVTAPPRPRPRRRRGQRADHPPANERRSLVRRPGRQHLAALSRRQQPPPRGAPGGWRGGRRGLRRGATAGGRAAALATRRAAAARRCRRAPRADRRRARHDPRALSRPRRSAPRNDHHHGG